MASFIALKWEKVQKYFKIQSFIFFSFVVCYSGFLIYMFNRPENHSVTFPTDNKKNDTNVAFLQEPKPTDVLLSKFDGGFIFWEVCFFLLTAFLVFFEFYQAWKLRRQYVIEWENWMELTVLAAATVTMASKHILLGDSLGSDIVRGISALGICFAWLELILLIGRYPFKGGDFSIMFYRIIKRLFRYIFALFLMILGHAFAFMVINYGIEKDSFESWWKSFVMTMTMALGEFQFEDLYNSFGDDKTSRTFAMIVLVSLILFGTITMINLFIAVIISDIKNLETEVFSCNLNNMAQCTILAEAILPAVLLKGLKIERKKNFCVHDLSPISNKDCKNDKMPTTLFPLISDVKKIAKEKRRRQQ